MDSFLFVCLFVCLFVLYCVLNIESPLSEIPLYVLLYYMCMCMVVLLIVENALW